MDATTSRATVLHYLAANGVEGYRPRSPANAVELATILLDAGADPNALQDSYGGSDTTMAMLVSSSPPKAAGVHGPTPLGRAEYCGQLRIAALLQERLASGNPT